jgi:hypothetical protein
MKLVFLFLSYFLFLQTAFCQKDSLGKVSVEGYIDTYYGYDFSNPSDLNRAYFVSSARHHEFNINLAFVSLKYENSQVRGRFAPAVGTYMNSNYGNESLTLKHVLEASVGFKPFKNRNIWLDIGVLSSPHTNESAISKDQLVYSRSFAAEYAPYYLSGARLTLPIHKRLNFYFYIVNGWQVIQDNNSSKSIVTQFEYKPNERLALTWNTQLGNEKSALNLDYRMRYFSDVYAVYNMTGKFSLTACASAGLQRKIIANKEVSQYWWQANVMARYRWTNKFSFSGRFEYYNDKDNVQLKPITSINPFDVYSGTACLNFQVTDNLLVRFESRHFFSKNAIFFNSNHNESNTNHTLLGNVCLWF